MAHKKFDKKKLEQFKKLLLKMREDLVHDIHNIDSNRSLNDANPQDAGHVQHMADVATDMYEREFNMGLASKDREILQKIEDALVRIEKGTYGFCLETGKAISIARLKALPYAEYCLEYQEELEKNNPKA